MNNQLKKCFHLINLFQSDLRHSFQQCTISLPGKDVLTGVNSMHITARKYDVHNATIADIIHNRHWKNV